MTIKMRDVIPGSLIKLHKANKKSFMLVSYDGKWRARVYGKLISGRTERYRVFTFSVNPDAPIEMLAGGK